jgi:hypothetical protein
MTLQIIKALNDNTKQLLRREEKEEKRERKQKLKQKKRNKFLL